MVGEVVGGAGDGSVEGVEAMRGRWEWLIGLILGVMGIWLNTRENDFPYYYHPDEFKKVDQVLTGQRNFNHPLLLLSSTEAVWKVTGGTRERQRVVELGRWVSAVLTSVGTVGFFLAGWWWRGALAGVVTGILLTLHHQVFELAHYMKEDSGLYCGAGLVAMSLVGFWRKPGEIWALVLGASVGCAFSGKYLGVILILPALVLIRVVEHPRKGRLLAGLFLGLVGVFLVINYRLLVDWGIFQKSFGKEMDWAISGQSEVTRRVPHSVYLSLFVANTTPVVWGFLGFFLMDQWRGWGKKEILGGMFLGLVVGWMVVLSFSPKTNDRYFLPVTGLIYLLGGVGAGSLARARGVVIWGIFLVVGSLWEGWGTMGYWKSFRVDDRADLVAWMRLNIPLGATIGYDTRVGLPDPQIYGDVDPLGQRLIHKTFVADLGTEEEMRAKGIDYVVISESTYGRFFLESLRTKRADDGTFERRRKFYEGLKKREAVWERDRGRGVYLHPGLEVYELGVGGNAG